MMSAGREEGPVYYREIQKNAYLKRIPNEQSSSKLLPLGHKKPPLKAMWTLFCVHNGRTPFLEQYPSPEAPSTLAHKPTWRACLRSARHVTASVRPRGAEYDFLVDTDSGPVRMLAPDWESMQDWVSTLRNKLHELKIVGKGENVYCAPPAPAPPRAAARDPTSPLPPTPPVPPDRVPGIELTTPPTRSTQPEPVEPQPERVEPEAEPQPAPAVDVDISNWEPETEPSTSQPLVEPKRVAKICGQNICLDDSIFKRNVETTDSDEEFFAEIDRLHESVENLSFDEHGENFKVDFKQRVVVNEDVEEGAESGQIERPTNITVIQVSNKPPHTAIPILGPSTDIFNFDFKQNVPVTDGQTDSFINIVNTEINVHNTTDDYGTVFTKESDYGHISLTTTVNLSDNGSPTVNLSSTSDNGISRVNGRHNSENAKTEKSTVSLNNGTNVKVTDNGIYERLCMASTSTDNGRSLLDKASPLPLRKLKSVDKVRKSSLPNLDTAESTYEYLFPNNNTNKNTTVALNSEPQSLVTAEVNSNVTANQVNVNSDRNTSVNGVTRGNSDRTNSEISRVHLNLTNSVSVGNVELSARAVRSSVERSHSQNTYDSSPRRELIRRVQNLSPKRDGKNDKTEVHPKPIWKRGLTELSLLSRLRGIGQGKRQDIERSPTRQENENDRGVSAPAKVVHRSRPEGRVDSTRRRSSSLSNGAAGAGGAGGAGALVPLRARQALCLRAEQRRGAAPAALPARDPPLLVDYNRQIWIAWWGAGGARAAGRCGDRLAALRGAAPHHAAHAKQLFKASPTHVVDILFHRVPLGKIYVLNKRDLESIGIKLDSECNITRVEPASPAARAGLPPPGRWAVTEVNNRPINLIKGGEEEMNRLSLHGTEVSVLIQPSPLVKKLRAALKAHKR